MSQWAKDNDFLNKVLFVPPPPGYERIDFPQKLVWLGPKGERFPCLTLFPMSQKVHYVMLYCHGNGCDLGGVATLLRAIMLRLQIGIVAPDYPGYGLSEGTNPCETSVKNCGKLSLEFIVNELEIPLERIILMGTSIGTGVVSWLAKKVHEKKRKLGGIILQSPFTSIKAIIKQVNFFESSVANFFAQVGSTFIADRFPNKTALQGIKFPMLVLHGAADELIPATHGKMLFDNSSADLKQLVVFPGVGHNNFDWNVVISKLRAFLERVARYYQHEKKIFVTTVTPKIKLLRKGPSGHVEKRARERAKQSMKVSGIASSTMGSILGSAIGVVQSLAPEARPADEQSISKPIVTGTKKEPSVVTRKERAKTMFSRFKFSKKGEIDEEEEKGDLLPPPQKSPKKTSTAIKGRPRGFTSPGGKLRDPPSGLASPGPSGSGLSDQWTCPSCMKIVSGKYKSCPNCTHLRSGRKRTAPVNKAPETPKPSEPLDGATVLDLTGNPWACTVCGANNDGSSQACIRCTVKRGGGFLTWSCPMCGATNAGDLTQCSKCTLLRPTTTTKLKHKP